MESREKEKKLLVPVLGLAIWSFFWIFLIQAHEGGLSESLSPALQEPASSSALRVTAAQENGGKLLERELNPPVEPVESTDVSEEEEAEEEKEALAASQEEAE